MIGVVTRPSIPAAEMPRERALCSGIRALSDREVLAALLGTGPPGEGVLEFSGRILDEVGGLSGLAGASPEGLLRLKGIGPGRAAQLAAAVEVGRRALRGRARSRPVIRSPADLVGPLRAELGGEAREVLGVFLLDTRMRLIGFRRVSEGTLAATPASSRDVFACALAAGAAAVVLAHNHPSGDPTPSPDDLQATRRLERAGRELEIPVIDHLILGGDRVVSLREAGTPPRGAGSATCPSP